MVLTRRTGGVSLVVRVGTGAERVTFCVRVFSAKGPKLLWTGLLRTGGVSLVVRVGKGAERVILCVRVLMQVLERLLYLDMQMAKCKL